MAYVKSGPFVNGSSPGISAAFLNSMETQLFAMNSASTDANISATSGILTALALNANTTAISVNGQTSGTAALHQVLVGTIKLVVVVLTTYRNTAAQEVILPTAMTAGCIFWAGNMIGNTASLRQTTTDQSLRVFQDMVGTVSTTTTFGPNSMGSVTFGFDRVRFPVSTGGGSGLIILLGT